MITGTINMWRDHKDSHEAIRHKRKEQANVRKMSSWPRSWANFSLF